MTDDHVRALDWSRRDAGMHDLTTKRVNSLTEILSVVRGLADGSLRCADSKTELILNRDDVEGLAVFAEDARDKSEGVIGRQWDSTRFGMLAQNLRGWLSTPEQPETETT